MRYCRQIVARLIALLHEYPILALGTLLGVGTLIILLHFAYLATRLNQLLARQYAALLTRTLEKVREEYATQVIDRIHSLILVTDDYQRHTAAIPFPATFSINLADKLSAEGQSVRIYSEYPFPSRTNGGPHDAFEQEALVALRHHPDTPFVRVEAVAGQSTLRLAQAIRMRQECVGCHNTRHDSPKTGWQPGDVRGVQEVMLALPPVWGGSATSLGWTLGGMLVLALGGVGLLAMVVTRLRTSVQETAAANRQLAATNTALDRFVPHDFLQRLDKANITEVSLGDHVQQEMTILFSDIRNFTALSEGMTPEANFQFLNAYLGGMGPMVREYGGFIDKYLGDGIMALFPQADAALEAALAMLHHLEIFNHARQQRGESPIAIGIGLNTGHLMLGTIGEYHRMEGTVISDAVNLASRMEGLTKQYGTPLLVSHHTVARLQETERLPLRLVDRVTVKGKHDPVEVYEVYAADRPEVRTLKALTGEDFAIALKHYQHGEFTLAQALFQSCWQRNPADRAAALYVERCTVALRSNLSDTWDGVTHLDSK